MLPVDALDERFLVIARLRLVVEHEIEASLVECHGVGAGKDAHILELRVGRMTVTITVHTHIIHHININDVLAVAEILVHSLCGGSHALQKVILLRQVLPQLRCILHLASRVYVCFAVGRCHADALVLQHASETAHGMSLEVGEVHQEIVVGKMVAHDVILKVFLVLHG